MAQSGGEVDGILGEVHRRLRDLGAFILGFLRGYTWSHHLDTDRAADPDRDRDR